MHHVHSWRAKTTSQCWPYNFHIRWSNCQMLKWSKEKKYFEMPSEMPRIFEYGHQNFRLESRSFVRVEYDREWISKIRYHKKSQVNPFHFREYTCSHDNRQYSIKPIPGIIRWRNLILCWKLQQGIKLKSHIK